MDGLILSRRQMDAMQEHVRALSPQEACGLLAGRNSDVAEIIPVTNQAHSPVRFIMDPIEQVKALNWIEQHGMELVGIFHSHPNGPEGPSLTDIEEAAYEVIYIIWSRQGQVWEPRGYRIQDGQTHQVSLILREGQ